jgi:hypothetical protein
MWGYPTVYTSTQPSSDTGAKATTASAKRITMPDQRALTTLCTAASAMLPPVMPVK